MHKCGIKDDVNYLCDVLSSFEALHHRHEIRRVFKTKFQLIKLPKNNLECKTYYTNRACVYGLRRRPDHLINLIVFIGPLFYSFF